MEVYLRAPVKKSRPVFPKRGGGLFPAMLAFLGLFLVGQALFPIASWYFFVMPGISERIVSPLAVTFPSLVAAGSDEAYQPASWFVGQKESAVLSAPSALKSYTMTIPKLGIETAAVVVGGDLKKSLSAWPASAPPGSYGNNVVFGHSELPQFYHPRDYRGMFTYLMDLQKDDVIDVDYDGVRFRYAVFEKKVVDPTDLSVLEQQFDGAYLTLITCVPPGTLWKRGIVKARLVTP